MPAGRPRKPLERRELEARGDGRTVRGSRVTPITGTVVEAPRLSPPLPDGLGERGVVEWAKVWDAGWWLKPDQDYHWVEMLARAYDDIEAFRGQVRREGRLARGSMGQVVAHPLIGEARKCEVVIMRCLATLGFSPSDRARLNLTQAWVLVGLQSRAAANRRPRAARKG
jgi:P27 family predicted phage terminase small subunit